MFIGQNFDLPDGGIQMDASGNVLYISTYVDQVPIEISTISNEMLKTDFSIIDPNTKLLFNDKTEMLEVRCEGELIHSALLEQVMNDGSYKFIVAMAHKLLTHLHVRAAESLNWDEDKIRIFALRQFKQRFEVTKNFEIAFSPAFIML